MSPRNSDEQDCVASPTAGASALLQPLSVSDDDHTHIPILLPENQQELTQVAALAPPSPVGSPVGFPLASPANADRNPGKRSKGNFRGAGSLRDSTEEGVSTNKRSARPRSRSKRERPRRNEHLHDSAPPSKRPAFLQSDQRHLPVLAAASSILNSVQQACQDKPELVAAFVDALSLYNQDQDLSAVLDTVSNLFAFSPDLIDAIHRFLPPDPRFQDLPPLDSELPDEQQQQSRQRRERPRAATLSQFATIYIEKVQERFESRPFVYPAFLKLLRKYKDQVDYDPEAGVHVRNRIAKLFSGHADLIREFERFL